MNKELINKYCDTEVLIDLEFRRIKEELVKHSDKFSESNKTDWGFLGDLNNLLEKLKEVGLK